MKIKGARQSKKTVAVEIMGGKVTLKPVSMFFALELEEELPEPAPPIKGVVRDGKGRIIRDENGAATPVYDLMSLEYKKAVGKRDLMTTVKMIADSVADGLEFDADPALRAKDPEKYYEALLQEMNEYGLTIGDLNKIGNSIQKISGIDVETVQETERNF
jgi:hypothetical protein